MARSSPAVQRVASVLNFFAEHPGHAFTLTDLVKGLKLSRATCHALLTGLVEVGYLYRTSEKTYVLGPALAAIGRSASTNYSPLQVAQPEMRALADEFDAICSAFFRDGNDAVVRERAAAVSHLGWSMPRGARLPLRPPFAAIFFAWSPPAEAETWLDQLDPPPNAQQRARMFEGMAFTREYGFMCVRAVRPAVVSTTNEWLVPGDSNSPVEVMLKFETDKDYAVSSITAPVFGADGRVAFVMGLVGMTGLRSGVEIMRIGTRLREACNRVSSFSTPLRVAASR
jgi:DNA-binding IclR family transcriptional regulator